MLTVYSAAQQAHRPAYVVKSGVRSRSFDTPERIDSILAAIQEKGLGSRLPTPASSSYAPCTTPGWSNT